MVITILLAATAAHHEEKHLEEEEDADEIIPKGQETESLLQNLQVVAQSRHHTPPTTIPNQATAILMPYPALRSPPHHFPAIQYVPVFPQYPAARQGLGGGVSGNLGPLG